MSSTAIDQMFQITKPTPTSRESSRVDNSASDLFRAHLKRAADVSQVKQPVEEKTELEHVENDDPLGAPAEREQTPSGAQEESRATSDSTELPESSEALPADDETDDEVTLSAAAVADTANAEIAATLDQASSVAAVEGTLIVASQQQLGLQSAAGPATASLGDTTEHQGTAQQRAAQSAIALADSAGDRRKTTDLTATSVASRSTTGPSSETLAVAEANESEARPHATQRGERKSDMQAFKLASPETSATIETELASSTKLSAAEANSATTNTPTTTPNSAALAGAERSLGSIASGKATPQANSASGRETNETPTVDRARFVHRVGGAIRTAQQRDGQIQLRLSPPELGTLRIQIAVAEGVVTAHLETETAAARTLLLDNLPALRERLAEQEIRIEKFDVDVGREGGQQPDNRGAEERQANRSRAERPATTERASPQSSNSSQAESAHSPVADGLDVRI